MRCEGLECEAFIPESVDDAPKEARRLGWNLDGPRWLCPRHHGLSPSDETWNAAIEAAANIAAQAKREAHLRRGISGGQDYLRAEGELQVASSIADDIRALKREAK